MSAKPKNEQEDFWSGDFGRDYTDRNNLTAEGLDELYLHQFGVSRTEMNQRFLGNQPRQLRILEVGCNVGMQLRHLLQMGFRDLYGIELQWHALKIARERVPDANLLQGSGFDLPFRDGYFDLVYTSGVLIHIAPQNLPAFMGEIVRCSSRYVWGFEYFAEEVTDINYRGNAGFLWKANYAKLYQQHYPALKLVKQEVFPYRNTNGSQADAMFLLEK
jgi:pseudaminic acid biosynthesis-associated methylase